MATEKDEPKADKAPAAEPKKVYVVKALYSCFDDEGKLRERGDIFVTTRAELIGNEVEDATRTAQTVLDEDQKAILKLVKQ